MTANTIPLLGHCATKPHYRPVCRCGSQERHGWLAETMRARGSGEDSCLRLLWYRNVQAAFNGQQRMHKRTLSGRVSGTGVTNWNWTSWSNPTTVNNPILAQ